MAVTYGYFNSLNGDRKYNADQMSEYFEGLITDGVYEDIGDALIVKANSPADMKVKVGTGRAIINCKWLRNTAAYEVTIPQSHATLNRWDAVIVRLDVTNRQMLITIKSGTPAASPTKPDMTDSETIKEICLAYVFVGAAVTIITQSNITDARASSACGWVTGLIEQVDTSELFLQWQDAYETYYEDMTEEFETWFQQLVGDLRVNTYIQKYSKVVTFDGTSGENTISLDMSTYTYDSADVINVHINGLLGIAGTDYTLSTSGTTPIVTTQATASGTVVDIEVLKSKIGFNTVGTSNLRNLSTSNGTVIRIS